MEEPRTTLPLDILLHIIDLLAGGDDKDIRSLQTLSLTCKFFVSPCRKHLFSSLNLHSELNSERFSDLLSKNPDIARYVTSLNYRVYDTISFHELNILDMLKKHSSLQSIQLLSPGSFDWNDFPELIRSSLIFLIQLPTVSHLDLIDFKGFPAIALSGCSNLIDLQLQRLEFSPPSPEVNQVISSTRISTPISLRMTKEIYHGLATLLNSASLVVGGPIVDFSRLQKVEFVVESQDDIFQVNELIKLTTLLEYFYMGVGRQLQLAGLGTSLAIHTHRSLRLLGLDIIVVGDDYDPVRELSRELRFIAGKNNILEELELIVMVEDHTSYRTETEDWAAFDLVLTESGSFPMLHRVLVKICWGVSSRAISDEEDVMLRTLKRDKFPRLVESKAVEFKFGVEIKIASG